jgi:3-oxoacyl-[acyl-carrier protein] reductase
MTLKGRTALVTGASRGIGRAIALRLAREGAAVGINYRERVRDVEALANDIRNQGGRALPLRADVSDTRAVGAMIETLEAESGPIDILINNAGVFRQGDLADFDYSQMEGMRRTNVDGLVNATRAVVPGMQARGFGRIVNLTSIAAHGTVMAGTTFYAATKAAVSVLTRRFAMELGPHGVTVNAIAPGFIATEMVAERRSPAEIVSLSEQIAAKTMVRRVGKPEDIAHVVAFLVSADSGFITGQVITVDGGRMDYIGHP